MPGSFPGGMGGQMPGGMNQMFQNLFSDPEMMAAMEVNVLSFSVKL